MSARSIVVYMPSSIDGYELCHPVDQDDFESINAQVKGVPRSESWKPVAMQMIREDEGRKLLESDSPWLGSHALIFRPRAVEVLGPLMREHGELLPVECGGVEVSIFNPTLVINALDEVASSVLRFSSGRIMKINRYAFHDEAVRGIHFFKIPNIRVSPTFVSEQVVELWKKAGLRGLGFKQIWASK